MVLAQGGWDTTYALDPKVQSATVDVPAGAMQTFGDLDVFTDASRPNVTRFFTKYADAHRDRARHLGRERRAPRVPEAHGDRHAQRDATPTWARSSRTTTATTLPLPYLILGDTAFTGPYAVSAGRVGATNQIIALLDPAQAYRPNGRDAARHDDAEDAILRELRDARRPIAHARRAARSATTAARRRLRRGDRARQASCAAVRDGFGTRGRTLTLDEPGRPRARRARSATSRSR